MKYTLTLEISVPRSKLAQLYVDPKNWSEWQDNLIGYEILNEENRQAGSKTRLRNRFGKKEIEIIETVEINQLPDLFVCTYEAKGAWNRVINRFTEIDSNNTRWEFDTEFKCRGILRFMAFIMPGMFRKSTLKEMNAFKSYVEHTNIAIP